MITHQIEEFGKRMGIEDLDASSENIFSFEIEDIGTLNIEKDDSNEEFFVYLSVIYPLYESSISKKVLEICNYKHAHPFILHGGVYNNTIIFFISMSFREVTASYIETATQFLIEITKKIS